MTSGELHHLRDLECAWMIRPFPGSMFCGDGIHVDETAMQIRVAMIDGLGHGQSASEFTRDAVAHLSSRWKQNLVTSLHDVSDATEQTVGGTVGLLSLDKQDYEVRVSIIGNITFCHSTPEKNTYLRGTESYTGSARRRIESTRLNMAISDILLVFSDGLESDINIEPSLRLQPARAIVERLMDENAKAHDDASCLVIKRRRHEPGG